MIYNIYNIYNIYMIYNIYNISNIYIFTNLNPNKSSGTESNMGCFRISLPTITQNPSLSPNGMNTLEPELEKRL